MPDETKNPPNYPVILLIISLTAAIVMGVIYLKSSDGNLSRLFTTDSDLKEKVEIPKSDPQQTYVYEGYVQGIVPQKKDPSDVEYTYLFGLIDRNGNSVPVWVTNSEFEAVKFYDSGTGTRTPIEVKDIQGGELLRITRTEMNGVLVSIIVDRFK